MKKAAIIITLALAGCASAARDAERASATCRAGGVAPGSAAFSACVSEEMAKIERARAELGEEIGNALSAGFQSYGNSMQQAAPAPRRQTTCTSTRLGTSVQTTCY